MKAKLIRFDRYFRIAVAFPFGFVGIVLITIANLISPEAIKLRLE